MSPIQHDNSGQPFIDVKNIRLTVKHTGWDGLHRHLSARAYTGSGNSLMMGPEIPIPNTSLSDEEILQLVGGLFETL